MPHLDVREMFRQFLGMDLENDHPVDGRRGWRRVLLGLVLKFLRRFGLLCLTFALIGLLIGGDEFTFTAFAMAAVGLAPLLLLQRFIIGPRFPYLRPGILVVMLLVVMVSNLGIPPYFDRHAKNMAMLRATLFFVPTVAVLGVLYGFVVDMAGRLYRRFKNRGDETVSS